MTIENKKSTGTCPVCRVSTEAERAYSEGATDFLICGQCRIAFRERLPTIEELAAIYSQYYQENNVATGNTNQESGEYALTAYARFIWSKFAPRLGRVLDYGAGTGRLVELFRCHEIMADGLEFSADARKFCRTHRGFDLLAECGQMSDDAYQFITLIEVIEHLPALMDDLAEIHRALSPEGELFITTPNRRGLRARIEKGQWQEASKKFHLVLFDNQSLKATLLKAGFTDVKVLQFSPIQKRGIGYWLYGRVCQCLGVSGTLCAVARK